VPLANLPDKLKPLVAAAFELCERKALAQRIPGPFCSELVARVYDRTGLALFDQGRASATISPNDLAKSILVRVEGAVISSSSVNGFQAMEPLSNIAERLFPITGDAQAQYRRAQRSVQRKADELDEMSRSMKEESRAQIAVLRSTFQRQIEGTFQLFQEAQASGNEGLTRWALRICKDCLEFAPELAALSEESLDMERMKVGLLKVNELGTSFFRCSVISKSQLLRRAVATRDNPFKRARLRRARRRVLREARDFLRLRLRTRTFVGKMLTPITG
jgi:hypothetical protein